VDQGHDDGEEGGLRAFLDSGAMDRAAASLRRRLGGAPDDPALLRDLGDVLRQKGDLDGAARVFRRLRDRLPGDAAAARLAALLAGEAAPPEPAIPAKFLRLRDFLPRERLDALRAHVRKRRRAFRDTAVRYAGGEDRPDAATRKSSYCADVAAIREWFDPLLLAAFPEACRRHGIEPFAPRVRSCKLSAWHDGCFFRLHQDQATGEAATRRLGFLYYFHFPPPRFEGGELLLYDRDPTTLWPRPTFTSLPPEGNTLAIIPANAWHEVLPVRLGDPDWYAARFTFSGWIHDGALMGEEEDAPSADGGEEGP
jgi:hypothetical protein